jgi:hypothetical protein
VTNTFKISFTRKPLLLHAVHNVKSRVYASRTQLYILLCLQYLIEEPKSSSLVAGTYINWTSELENSSTTFLLQFNMITSASNNDLALPCGEISGFHNAMVTETGHHDFLHHTELQTCFLRLHRVERGPKYQILCICVYLRT